MKNDHELQHLQPKFDLSPIKSASLSTSIDANQLKLLKIIAESKFPIFLASSEETSKQYAVKVYPYENNTIHPSFYDEVRFTDLEHPNMIKFYGSEKARPKTLHSSRIIYESCIIMELAPYGSLADLVMDGNWPHFDEKLVRTYFHQLIDVLHYIHQKGIAHLDIKLENLMIGEDFLLRLIDFDTAWKEGDRPEFSRGSRNFRAPEQRARVCRDPKKADIYAAGIILFTLKAGTLPYIEGMPVNNLDFLDLLYNNPETFWKGHEDLKNNQKFDDSFKSLFLSMTSPNPEKRFSIEDIKRSDWYQGTIYSPEELKVLMSKTLNLTKL